LRESKQSTDKNVDCIIVDDGRVTSFLQYRTFYNMLIVDFIYAYYSVHSRGA